MTYRKGQSVRYIGKPGQVRRSDTGSYVELAGKLHRCFFERVHKNLLCMDSQIEPTYIQACDGLPLGFVDALRFAPNKVHIRVHCPVATLDKTSQAAVEWLTTANFEGEKFLAGSFFPKRGRGIRRKQVAFVKPRLTLADCLEIEENLYKAKSWNTALLKQSESGEWVPLEWLARLFRLERMRRSRRNLTLARLPVFRQAKIPADLIQAPKCSAACTAEICNSWLGERTEKLIQWFYRTAMPPENLFRGAIRAYLHPRPHKDITRPRNPNLLDEAAMSVHGGQPFRERPPRSDDKVPIDLFKQATENSRCDMQMLRAAEFVLAYGMKQTDAAARYGVSQRSLERNVQKFRKMVLSLEPEPHSLCEQQREFAL